MEVHIAAMTRRSRPKMRWQAGAQTVCLSAGYSTEGAQARRGPSRISNATSKSSWPQVTRAPTSPRSKLAYCKNNPNLLAFGRGRALMAQAEKERLQAKGRLRPQNSGVLTNKHVFRKGLKVTTFVTVYLYNSFMVNDGFQSR